LKKEALSVVTDKENFKKNSDILNYLLVSVLFSI